MFDLAITKRPPFRQGAEPCPKCSVEEMPLHGLLELASLGQEAGVESSKAVNPQRCDGPCLIVPVHVAGMVKILVRVLPAVVKMPLDGRVRLMPSLQEAIGSMLFWGESLLYRIRVKPPWRLSPVKRARRRPVRYVMPRQ